MKMNKQNYMVMITLAAVILMAFNAAILVGVSKGAIAPVNNIMLWGGFVVLNVVSILWAISLLGLQPFVVAFSYVAGGALAYMGVQGAADISVAEVITAGATYGAFGALAIGNLTAKVRFVFFKKGQIPVVFVIIGLLVLDAVLNSEISSASGTVILNVVIFPFVLSGVIVGLIWSVLNRYGIGRKPAEVLAAIAEETPAKSGKSSAVSSKKLVIKIPEAAVVAEEQAEVAPPKPSKKGKKSNKVKPVAPVVAKVTSEVAQPVVAPVAPVEEAKPEEAFFPLENDTVDFLVSEKEPDLIDVMALSDADTSESPEDSAAGDDAVADEPVDSISLDTSESPEDSAAGDDAVADEPVDSISLDASESPKDSAAGDDAVEDEPADSISLDTEKEPDIIEEDVQAIPEKKDHDWLGGHLDLLNKLK